MLISLGVVTISVLLHLLRVGIGESSTVCIALIRASGSFDFGLCSIHTNDNLFPLKHSISLLAHEK